MQDELHERLIGKIYDHLPICNGDRRKPKGHGICCCLNSLKKDEIPNIMLMEETITITRKEYNQLLEDSNKLRCLENNGVDNWTWYGEAMKEFYAEQEE